MSNTENIKLIEKSKPVGLKIQRQANHASKSNDPVVDFVALINFFKNGYDDTSILKINKKDKENVDFYLENLTYDSLFNFEIAFATQVEMFEASKKVLNSLIANSKGELRSKKNE